MSKSLRKTTLREIRHSFGRFLSITCIIALGVGFFAGLKASRPDMVQTADSYLSEHAFFDYKLLNTLGFDEESVKEAQQQPDILAAEGAFSADLLMNDGEDDRVYKIHSIPEQINTLSIVEGRTAQNANECVADKKYFGKDAVGKTLTVSEANDEDGKTLLKEKTYTIVGIADSPLYLNYERGATALGNGSVAAFLYVPKEAFDSGIYTELYLKLNETHEIYSEEYSAYIDEKEDSVKALSERLADLRFAAVKNEANQTYSENFAEYEKNLHKFQSEKANAEKELADAAEKIADEKNTFEEKKQEYLTGLHDWQTGKDAADKARKQLNDGLLQLNNGIGQAENAVAQFDSVSQTVLSLTEKLSELEEKKKLLDESEQKLNENKKALEDGKNQTENGILQTKGAITQLENAIAQLEQIPFPEEETQKQLAELKAQKTAAEQTLAVLEQTRKELEEKELRLAESEKSLAENKKQLEDGLSQLNKGITEASAALEKIETAKGTLSSLKKQRTELERQSAQLAEKENEITEAKKTLDSAKTQLEDGEQQLKAAEKDLLKAQKEADEKFADAQKELDDAAVKLSDAKQEIEDIARPDSFALNRETNVGYVCFDSDSAIVDGIAKVFPLFFFLVAALMCMTTMTRMVDEQRTDIGVLKALGYSNVSIMFKYITYSGLAAVIGCGIGFGIGTVLFPTTIWTAYGILYGFAPIQLSFSPAMAIGLLLVSLFCTIGTTFYSCRGELKACAAQIMRPKAPKNGKRTFLERFRFFEKLKFLQKVSVRNIARYKQRFFMMILGIGGCMALLITGFGLRDSIQKIADYQYGDILQYDYAVSFTKDMTEEKQTDFAETVEDSADEMIFLHQASYDITTPGGIKTAYVIAPQTDGIEDFIHLEYNKKPVAYPKTGEAVVTRKLAETNKISIGSKITVTNGDQKQAVLTVSNICENYVYNYVYTTMDSLGEGWGETPAVKTAFVNTPKNADLHETAAVMMNRDGVGNVLISSDLQQRISSMLGCLDYIILLVILCAGMLAFIVIYNLTNINITERRREIATIKVLGFYAKETAAYVFGENLVLTAIGAFVGIWLGKALHLFVMSQINIDMVSFHVRVAPISYVASVILTFAFSALVDFFLNFKLKKIDMAQSLKSIE